MHKFVNWNVIFDVVSLQWFVNDIADIFGYAISVLFNMAFNMFWAFSAYLPLTSTEKAWELANSARPALRDHESTSLLFSNVGYFVLVDTSLSSRLRFLRKVDDIVHFYLL